MSITHAHTTAGASALATGIALAIALVAAPAHAADGPARSSEQSTAPAQAKPKAKPKAKPRARSRNTLDAAARRALRASSTRDAESLDGERVAMRTVAPAADADPPKRRKSKKKPGKGDDEGGAPSDASDRKISLDEDFLVEGKLEKPNAFYILRRSQSGYDWARLDAKFLPLVLESVQDPLF